jgi:hypothetical protein
MAKFCYVLKFYLGDKLGKIVGFQCEIFIFPAKNFHFQEIKKKKKKKVKNTHLMFNGYSRFLIK